MIKIPKSVLYKIYMTYWGNPCRYKDEGGQWVNGFLNEKTIQFLHKGDLKLVLRDLSELTSYHVNFINKIMHKFSDNKDEELAIEQPTESELQEYREHLADTISFAPYPIVDYIRREGFHVPVFGLDLYMAGVAQKPYKKKVATS
jgi:hypothetical protein